MILGYPIHPPEEKRPLDDPAIRLHVIQGAGHHYGSKKSEREAIDTVVSWLGET
ncbi:MAG: hypothetical protein ACKVPX_17250 [Myxococcaceae bacterium]